MSSMNPPLRARAHALPTARSTRRRHPSTLSASCHASASSLTAAALRFRRSEDQLTQRSAPAPRDRGYAPHRAPHTTLPGGAAPLQATRRMPAAFWSHHRRREEEPQAHDLHFPRPTHRPATPAGRDVRWFRPLPTHAASAAVIHDIAALIEPTLRPAD